MHLGNVLFAPDHPSCDTEMIVGIPKESYTTENSSGNCGIEKRVAASPQSVQKLIKLGYDVVVETGAGELANFPDDAFENAGAKIASADSVWTGSDIVLKVRPPVDSEYSQMQSGSTLVSFVWPAQNECLVSDLEKSGINALAMDCVPRISRAQKLDALSSMANIAGYRAVIEAANEFGSFFTGQITAAGKVPPAKVLVIGAGVAGLAAIGAANGLGAIVRAFDTRPSVKDQVKSMGAEFLELDFEEDGEGSGGYAKTMSKEFIEAEMALFAEQAKEVDIIITTALIPGKPAPKLITAEMVRSMKPGSVIVDLAAEQGGNCELTEPYQRVVKHGVTILGYTDFPSRLPTQSSNLYANNLVNLLADMTPEKDGKLEFDLDDEVVRGCVVTYGGETLWPPPPKENSAPAPKTESQEKVAAVEAPKPGMDAKTRSLITLGAAILVGGAMLLLGLFLPPDFIQHFTVFILACFVGWQVVWNVNPALHTPLMSVTNAISGIIIIGALMQIISTNWFVMLLAAVAVLIASINIAGGFWVTQRMLGMFRKD